MAVTYSVLGQVAPTNTSATTLYTAGAGEQVIISSIVVCNIHTDSVLYDLHMRPDGATLGNQHYLARNCRLMYGESECIALGVTMNASDVLAVVSQTANGVAATVFGVVITS